MHKEPWIGTHHLDIPPQQVAWRAEDEPADIYERGDLLLLIDGDVYPTPNVPYFWYTTLEKAQDAPDRIHAGLVAAAQGAAYGDTDHYDNVSTYLDEIDAAYDGHPCSLVAAADACDDRVRRVRPDAIAAGAVVTAYEYGRTCPAKASQSVYDIVGSETVSRGVKMLQDMLPRSILLTCCQARTFPIGELRIETF